MTELIKMNKGEWSEAYTFLKLLADGKLYAADKNLNKIESIYYPLIKVITEETIGEVEYIRNGKVKVINSVTNEKLLEIEIDEFISISEKLLKSIKSEISTFSNKEVEEFLYKVEHKKLKASSRDKRDITIVVHDIFTGFNPKLGFSIKSKLGNPSTLFNASQSTNFTYKVTSKNIDEDKLMTINSIDGKSKIIRRVQKIIEQNNNLKYFNVANENFLCNLQLIDSNLPLILSELLVYCYNENKSKLSDLLEIIEEKNPLKYNLKINKEFYRYKLKKFLVDVALGMRATDPWSGKFDATGGYIVVKESGELLCYHVYNMNEFEEYLLLNTRLETPSSRNKFGEVYKENGEFYFKLNLQIRFI